MELIRAEKSDFDEIYRAMEEAFPYAERRDRADAEAMLLEPRYVLYHTVENDARVGFVSLFLLDGITFVEHFVTYPAYRGRGLGTQVLAELQRSYGALLLEVEHPTTEIAARRVAFYRRAGFVANEYPYIQPSYHGKGCEVPLLLLSYPAPLDNPTAAVAMLYREVYHVR